MQKIIMLGEKPTIERPVVKVVGCGGAGCNMLTNLLPLTNIDLIALSSNPRHLLLSKVEHKILVEKSEIEAIGTAHPSLMRSIVERSGISIRRVLRNTDMVFTLCGFGGQTGSFGAPMVAKIATGMSTMVIGIGTFPFKAEGASRIKNANIGLENLRMGTNSIIILSNDKLLSIAPSMPLMQSFHVMGEIVKQLISNFMSTVTLEDLQILRSFLKDGKDMSMGMARSSGPHRDLYVVEDCLKSPWLDIELGNVRFALVFLTGGTNFKQMDEVKTITGEIGKNINKDATILLGSHIDQGLGENIKLTVLLGT